MTYFWIVVEAVVLGLLLIVVLQLDSIEKCLLRIEHRPRAAPPVLPAPGWDPTSWLSPVDPDEAAHLMQKANVPVAPARAGAAPVTRYGVALGLSKQLARSDPPPEGKKMIRAMNHFVVVERDTDQSETSQGGIIVPDSAKSPLTRGLVRSVGPLCSRESPDGPQLLQVGMRVFFTKFSGAEWKDGGDGHIFQHEGRELLAMREDSILGIIEEL